MSASGHYQRALGFERIGRDADAISELRHAIAISDDHAEALERLGNLLTKHGHRDEAIDCFRHVAELQPNGLLGRVSRAKVLLADDNQADAETCLHETIMAFPTSAEAKRLLANILREQGRFSEATPLLEQAMQGTPAQAANAYHDWTVSRTITEADAPMLQRMRDLLAHAALAEIHHPRLLFALGKALDDLGQYETAMRHFDAANHIVRHGQTFDGARFIAAVRGLVTVFSPEFIASRAGFGSPSDAPLLILGMPRSGTTLVEQIVSSHRDVAAGGELNFWNGKGEMFARIWRDRLTEDHIGRMAADYNAILRRIGPRAVRVTDKTPSNFLWIGLIRIVFPQARIIHCRRHPVDTCLSNYFTGFGERMPFAYGKEDLVLYYRHYARLMQHWRSVVPAEYLYEIDYEQLVTQPEVTIRRLIEFCGLDWDDGCLRPEANRRTVRTASLWQVRQPIFRGSIGRWRHYEPWLDALRELLLP